MPQPSHPFAPVDASVNGSEPYVEPSATLADWLQNSMPPMQDLGVCFSLVHFHFYTVMLHMPSSFGAPLYFLRYICSFFLLFPMPVTFLFLNVAYAFVK